MFTRNDVRVSDRPLSPIMQSEMESANSDKAGLATAHRLEVQNGGDVRHFVVQTWDVDKNNANVDPMVKLLAEAILGGTEVSRVSETDEYGEPIEQYHEECGGYHPNGFQVNTTDNDQIVDSLVEFLNTDA